jgi:hypothetical protein
MKVSEFGWRKNIDTGDWTFRFYRDDADRKWERGRNVTGYLCVMTPNRIDGYCKRGCEDEWKWKSIEEYKNKLNEHLVEIVETIDSLPTNELF